MNASTDRPSPRPLSRAASLALATLPFLFLLTFLPRPSLASPASDKLEAQKLLKQATAHLAAGDSARALDELRASYALQPTPKILLDLGTALRRLARNVEAAEAYEAYLRDPKADPALLDEARRTLADIDAVTARLRIEATAPAPTAVRLDGLPLADWKARALRLPPGEHTVAATAAGFPDVLEKLTLAPREERTVTLHFALPAPPVPTAQRTAGWVTGGVGAAAILAGSIAGLVAKVENDAAAAHCYGRTACDPDGVAIGASARTSGVLSTVLFATGAAALGAGVVLIATAPRPAPAPRAALLVGLDGGPWIGAKGVF